MRAVLYQRFDIKTHEIFCVDVTVFHCVSESAPRFRPHAPPPFHFSLINIIPKILSTVFEHNNHVYKFVFPEDDTRTWHEAESLCKTSENGHLTSLVSPGEIIWVDSVIKNAVRDLGARVKLWIGGSDRKINDVWDFVDGQPLRYNIVPWAPGQPKRPQQYATYEYCVSLEFGGERSVWYVDDCYETHGYICKADGT